MAFDNDPPLGSPTADDVATYLDIDDINERRAELFINQAMALAESYVSPVPPAGQAVVLGAVARAYTNAQGVTAETIGPYSVTRPAAGVYFTKAETANLKRLAGKGGAYSIDPTPADIGEWFDYGPLDVDEWGYPLEISSPWVDAGEHGEWLP